MKKEALNLLLFLFALIRRDKFVVGTIAQNNRSLRFRKGFKWYRSFKFVCMPYEVFPFTRPPFFIYILLIFNAVLAGKKFLIASVQSKPLENCMAIALQKPFNKKNLCA